MMSALVTGAQSASGFRNLPDRLQGVLIYEDLETGTRAKDVYDHLLYQIDAVTEMDLTLWRFDVLQDLSVNKRAASEAARADIVVLSAHDGNLPLEVSLWLRQWLAAKQGDSRSVLIVSLDRGRQEEIDLFLASLRKTVECAGVDLIPHYGESKTDLARTAERMSEWTEAGNALFWEGMPPRPTTYENWGLNE